MTTSPTSASLAAALRAIDRSTVASKVPRYHGPTRALRLEHLTCFIEFARNDIAFEDLDLLIRSIPGAVRCPGGGFPDKFEVELNAGNIGAARIFFAAFYSPASLPVELRRAAALLESASVGPSI